MRRLGLVLVAVAACKESPAPPSPTAPADCTKVAEIVTNFEVGPGAAPDTRSSAVARNLASCQAAKLTVVEATCIAKASDTWALKACAPSMFGPSAGASPTAGSAVPPTAGSAVPPTAGSAAPPIAGNSCKATTTRMREAIIADLPKDTGSAGIAMVDRMLVAIEQACNEDQWPASYRDCIVAAPSGDAAAYKKCDDMLSSDLQVKLGERLKPIIRSSP